MIRDTDDNDNSYKYKEFWKNILLILIRPVL